MILSPHLFLCVSEFKVLPFDPMISEAHNGIQFSIIWNETEINQDFIRVSTTVTRARLNKTEVLFNLALVTVVESLEPSSSHRRPSLLSVLTGTN